ncbi:unnamed protein product [Spirodela intermedia]|uniref:Uncharacterized protein n=1 Tax=Spirodela intermedia TaxID=51605 RepID=A0A7I8IER2_SPIIN|nr:unnamed protein product [Spirodela intermedia]CAA6655884.1 unnamed protein product [Spirodela intermedia]
MRSRALFLYSRRVLLHFAAFTTRSSSSPRNPPEQLTAGGGSPLSALLQPPCGLKPDEHTLSKALKAAAEAFGSPDCGRRVVHGFVIKLGFQRFTILMTALVGLVIRNSGDLREAGALFDELTERDVVAWTSLIVGYAQRGHYQESLDLFRRMVSEKSAPNSYSYSGALSACSGLRLLSCGREIHARLLKVSSHEGIEPVLQNNLLHLYSRCQDLSSSKKLFDAMPDREIISWNQMISCYLECGLGEDSLNLFARMISCGLGPDRFTYATCVDACGYIASLRQGIQVHTRIVKDGIHSDLVVGNALVDMYARCGSVGAAKVVFDTLSSRDAVLWTFEQMLAMKIKPDEITFLAVLSACSHGGLVSRGWHYFRSMKEHHGVSANLEHYSCVVDLLCRSGYLDEALFLMKQILPNPSVSMWTTFLNSCRIHGNDGQIHGNLVALSNVLAAQSHWNETGGIRRRMKEENVKKEPGCSWVETRDGFHVFFAGCRSHPKMHEILQALHGLNF